MVGILSKKPEIFQKIAINVYFVYISSTLKLNM